MTIAKNAKTGEYVDCTPTWESMLNVYLLLITDANAEGKATAREELRRMAQAADKYNALCKKKGA